MRKIAFGLLAIMSIAIFSCLDDDGYSLNDQWIGFGMVRDDSGTKLIKLDDGDLLRPVAWDYGLNQGEDFTEGERVLINFTILDEVLNSDGSVAQYLVKVNEAREILLKDLIQGTDDNADSIGNDPIVVQEFWMTDSLLNLKLNYRGYNQIHFLNLSYEMEDPTLEEPIKLNIRHNANDDDEALSYTAFVSFSLNQLRVAGKDSVQIEVSSTDYKGVTHTFSEVFDYSHLPSVDPWEQQ